jgi:hypothetical protein
LAINVCKLPEAIRKLLNLQFSIASTFELNTTLENSHFLSIESETIFPRKCFSLGLHLFLFQLFIYFVFVSIANKANNILAKHGLNNLELFKNKRARKVGPSERGYFFSLFHMRVHRCLCFLIHPKFYGLFFVYKQIVELGLEFGSRSSFQMNFSDTS